MKKIFLLFFIVLFVIPIALAVPVSYKGTVTYDDAEITTAHTIRAVSASRTTTKTINESDFVINHLVKKGEIVKFYFDDNKFIEYTQPLPGSVIDLGAWNIIPAGLPDLYKAKSDLTYTLILNGNPSKDSVIANLYLPTSLAAYGGVSIDWVPSDKSIIAVNGTVTRSTVEDKTVTLTATLSKTDETPIQSIFTVIVKKKVAAAVPTDGKVTVTYDEPEIVIDNSNINETENIEIPETVSANEIVSLNLQKIKFNNTVTLGNKNLTLTRKTNSSVNYSVEIPSNTTISGASDWNGLLNVPTVKDNSEVVVDGTTELVVEVGYTGGQLNFTKAVKLTLAGMTGKTAGYTHGTDITIISLACNSATDATNIVGNGECYYDDGIDLIIWTKHFTKFAAYIPTPPSPGGGPTGGGGGTAAAATGGGGGGGGVPAPAPTPAPAEEEEAPAEEIAEEVVPVEEAPAEEEARQGALARITGRAISAIGDLAGKVRWWQAVIAVVIIAVLIGGYYYWTYAEPSTADAYYAKAGNLHRKAEDLYRAGKTEKSEAISKKAQAFREKGERLQK